MLSWIEKSREKNNFVTSRVGCHKRLCKKKSEIGSSLACLSSICWGVKKSACLRIVCACMNKNIPWSGSRAQKYIVRRRNIIFSFLTMWLLRTRLLRRTSNKYRVLWNRSMGDFCSYTPKRFSGKPIFIYGATPTVCPSFCSDF